MPNINTVMNDLIRRIAKHEVKSDMDALRQSTAQVRRDIAELKRQIGSLSKIILSLQKEGPRTVEQSVPQETGDEMRFRADGLKSHRKRLGLSGKAYGKLVGVTGQTIYDWESGQSYPRKQQLGRLAAARQLGKREALTRTLPETTTTQQAPQRPAKTAATPAKRGARGRFDLTAEQFLMSLLKNKKVMDNAQIGAAWKASGRGSNADNTLSKLAQAGTLKRERAASGRGSRYSIA